MRPPLLEGEGCFYFADAATTHEGLPHIKFAPVAVLRACLGNLLPRAPLLERQIRCSKYIVMV